MPWFSIVSNPKLRKPLGKISGFWRNPTTTSQIQTICWIIERVSVKNLEATIHFVDLSKAFNSIQNKYGSNTTGIWSFQINYGYNDALQKHESNGSFTWWRYRLVQHCHWSLAIFVYTLPRLLTSNIHRPIKRKLFHIEKGKKKT